MPEGFGNLLDTIAALGFATAMNVSGVNIVASSSSAISRWLTAPTAEIYPFVAQVSIEQSLHLGDRGPFFMRHNSVPPSGVLRAV